MKKYTVIVMSELGESKRFAIRKSVATFCIILMFVLPIVTGVCIWFASSSVYENSLLSKKVHSLQTRIDILEAEQTRINNYNEYMNQKSTNVFTHPMKDVIDNAETLPERQRQDAMPLAISEIPENNDPTNLGIVEKHLETFSSLPFNLGVLTLDKIEVKPHKEKNRYYISYDLYNREKRGQVTGTVFYTLLKKGNKDDEFDLKPSRQTDFSINNYKKTNALLTLSEGIFDKSDVIKLSIVVEGSVVFMQLIPLGE